MLLSSVFMHHHPYAPPTYPEARPRAEWSDSPAAYLYDRDGMVELSPGPTLPEVCAKCGTETNVKRRYIPLVAREDWHYLLLAAGLLPYLAFNSSIARGAMWSYLCPHCEKSYDWAKRVSSFLAIPVACWMIGAALWLKADKLEIPGWPGLVLVAIALVTAVPVLVLKRTFVRPRVFKFGGPTFNRQWGPAMKVGGIHPRVMEAFLAAHAAKVAEYARYSQAQYAQHAHYAQPAYTPVDPGQGLQGDGSGGEGQG